MSLSPLATTRLYIKWGGSNLAAAEISSLRNPLVKTYLALARSGRQRRLSGKLALEGPHLLQELLRAGLVPEVVFYTRRYREQEKDLWEQGLPAQTRQCLVTASLFAHLAQTETPREVAAIAPLPIVEPPGSPSLALLLDRIRDPGNLGTLVRTAAAAGVGAIYCTSGCADPFNPKVLRSSAGAVFFLPPARIAEPLSLMADFKRRGGQAVVAAPGASRCYWDADFSMPTLIIIGNESSGVAPELVAAAGCALAIPQPGWECSLNAAVAAAVILYEARRQRSKIKSET